VDHSLIETVSQISNEPLLPRAVQLRNIFGGQPMKIRTPSAALTLLLIAATSLSATEPCIEMEEERFRSEVIKPSSLIVFGKIAAYSTANETAAERWTRVTIQKTLLSRGGPPAATITIKGWQAFDLPLFGHEKGSYVVLFLTGNDEYRLTNDEWKSCVPSIWNASEAGTAYPNFKRSTGQGGFIPLEAIEKIVQ
jgi:hypothetical protein